jgi:transcriptional regulator with XRE-family HTH domain
MTDDPTAHIPLGWNLLDIRTTLGVSRELFAKMLGWTGSRTWAIEKGRHTPTPLEVEQVRALLEDRLGSEDAVDREELRARDRVLSTMPDGAVRLVEWNGIEYGDTVRVRGIPGSFKFIFHHTDERQEYVEVYGGANGHALMRAVSPDRIITRKTKTRVRQETTTP